MVKQMINFSLEKSIVSDMDVLAGDQSRTEWLRGVIRAGHKPSATPRGRIMPDGLPFRAWLAVKIITGAVWCRDDMADPLGFAKDVLQIADAIEADAFKDA